MPFADAEPVELWPMLHESAADAYRAAARRTTSASERRRLSACAHRLEVSA